jgi:hypothetical protein
MVVNSKIGIFNSIAVLAQYIGAPPCLSPPVAQYSMFVRFLASAGGSTAYLSRLAHWVVSTAAFSQAQLTQAHYTLRPAYPVIHVSEHF